MTPLAHSIAKDSVRLVRDRTWPKDIHKLIYDIHCFDASAVSVMADELGQKMFQSGVPEDVCEFIPFERTWIETDNLPGMGIPGGGKRIALLLERGSDGVVLFRSIRHDGATAPVPLPLARGVKALRELVEDGAQNHISAGSWYQSLALASCCSCHNKLAQAYRSR